MATPLILLPPSEGKAPGGRGRPWAPGTCSFPELDERRTEVAEALAAAATSADDAALGKLLGVKGEALAAARAANAAVLTAGTKPAIERYTGVLYDALDHATLPAASKRRAGRQIVIFSGLWGLVTPGDRLPDYKLKMGATLAPVGRLASAWKPLVTEALAPVVAKRTVWDLLPGEHAAAWDPRAAAPRRRISVKFLDDVGTGRDRRLVAVSHWNKLLKGALVRHVLDTQLDDHEGLAEFRHPLGYDYRPDLTESAGDLTTVSLVTRRP